MVEIYLKRGYKTSDLEKYGFIVEDNIACNEKEGEIDEDSLFILLSESEEPEIVYNYPSTSDVKRIEESLVVQQMFLDGILYVVGTVG